MNPDARDAAIVRNEGIVQIPGKRCMETVRCDHISLGRLAF